jgi:hypothetical protein
MRRAFGDGVIGYGAPFFLAFPAWSHRQAGDFLAAVCKRA